MEQFVSEAFSLAQRTYAELSHMRDFGGDKA